MGTDHPLKNEINEVLKRHQIGPDYRAKFHILVNEGRITDPEFRTRLRHVANYETALYEILELLSSSYRDLFEVPSFESMRVAHGT